MRNDHRDWCVLWRLKGSPAVLTLEEMRTLPREALRMRKGWFMTNVGQHTKNQVRIRRLRYLVYEPPQQEYFRIRVLSFWAGDYDYWAEAKAVLKRLLANESPLFKGPRYSGEIETYLRNGGCSPGVLGGTP